MDKCICLRKNLLSGIFFLGIACSVLGETLENEDALETRVQYQVDNSTSVQQMYRDAVLNVSHNIPEVQTAPLPKSLDIQVSTVISSPSVQPEFEYRNDTQDDENSSQALEKISSDSFENNTSFNVSELEYQDNEEHIQMFTTTVRGKMDQEQADFTNTHHIESVTYDSVGTHYNTESPSIATVLLTQFASHLLSTTNTSQIEIDTHQKTVQVNDTQTYLVHGANQVITTVAPEVHYTTDLNTNEAPYNRVIFDQNLELMMNSTDRSLIADDFFDFGGTEENNIALDADGNHTSLKIGIGYSLTNALRSDKKQTLDTDGSYIATTNAIDEITTANETYSAEHYVTVAAAAPVFGESSILSRDETDEDMLTVTSRTGQDTSTKADLNTTVIGITNDMLTKSTTISEATEMYTNLGSHTESGSSLQYGMTEVTNRSGFENLQKASEDAPGNTTANEHNGKNCESQQGCEGKNTESEHSLDTLVTSPIYTSSESVRDETVVHGTPSSEEQISEKINHVEVAATDFYTVPPVFIGENSSMSHHKRSTFVTSRTDSEHHSSLLTVTTGPDSEIVSTSSDAEMLAFSDDGEQTAANSSIISSNYNSNLMNHSSFSTNVKEDAARVESHSEDQQPGERIATGNGGTQQQTTSFVNAQLSNLGAVSSVNINPTLSTNIFMSENSAPKNSLSTSDTVFQVATPLRINYDSHTSSVESSYSDAFDSDFNYITATENAQATASATTETVNELSIQAENNTETSTGQITRSAELYDMALSNANEQNNLNNPYTASISYKLTSESQVLSSIETSFGDSLSTEVSTKVMNISLQILTQSPLPSTSEVLPSSSQFNLPELSTESPAPFEYSTHRSDRALSQFSESMLLERNSDILSLLSNQSLRSPTSSSGSNEESPFSASSTEKLVTTDYDEFPETKVLSSSSQQEHEISTFSSVPTETTSTVQISHSNDNFSHYSSEEIDYSAITTHMTYTESDRVILPTDLKLPSEVSEDSSTSQVLLDDSKSSTVEFAYLTDTSEGTSSSYSTQDIHFSQNHSTFDALQKSVWSRVESMINMVSGNITNTFQTTDVTNNVTDFAVSSKISEENIGSASSPGSTESTDTTTKLSSTESTDTTTKLSSTESADISSSLSFTESADITSSLSFTESDDITSTLSSTETLLNNSLSSTESADTTSSLSFPESVDITGSLSFPESADMTSSLSPTVSAEITSSLSFTESADITSSQSFTESDDITSALSSTETLLTSSLSSTESADTTSSLSFTESAYITSSLSFTESDDITSTLSSTETLLTSSLSSTESADTTSSLSFTEGTDITSSLSFPESADITSSLSSTEGADTTSSLSSTEGADTTSSLSSTEGADTTSSLSSTEGADTTSSLSSTEGADTASSPSSTEGADTTSSLSFTETPLPRSSETLTSVVHLASDDIDTSMAISMEDKQKESTFTQDYFFHSTYHERMESKSPEVPTTEQTTHKYTQDFLTTQSKAFITQKEFESLTIDEMNNTITVVFKITQDVQQIDSYTRRFSKWMVKMLLTEIKKHKMKTSSSNVSSFEGKSSLSPTRIELIYILPSPNIFSEDLIFTFFAHIAPDNDTIPLSKVIDALLVDTDGMQNYMNLNLSYFIRGQYLQPNDMDGWTSLKQVWQKYGVLLLTVSILMLLIVVILIAAVVYVRCKSRQSIAYISDKDRLHGDLHDSTEIGDLNRGSVILADEHYEKDTSLVNGNHVVTIGDDEGWLVPINDVPMEDRDAPDVQDTKL